jgi:hypothetical protein
MHVLTYTDSSCLQITFGLRPAQQLLWCYHNVLAAQSEQRLASPSNVGMSVSGGQVAILLQDQPGTGAAQAYVHLLNATSDSMGPVHEYCLPVHNIRPEVGKPDVHAVHSAEWAAFLLLLHSPSTATHFQHHLWQSW